MTVRWPPWPEILGRPVSLEEVVPPLIRSFEKVFFRKAIVV